VYEFLQYVISQEKFQEQGEMLRCSCIKCSCKVFKYVNQVRWDLYQEGFMPNYYWWTNHGEELPQSPSVDVASSCYGTCEQREDLSSDHNYIIISLALDRSTLE